MRFSIQVLDDLKSKCPSFKGCAITATVTNTSYSAELWDRIHHFIEDYRNRYTADSIKDIPSIQATRIAYKKCGKDPSRYRPSGEALCRRIIKGMDLYQIDSMVDLVNLASIAYGYSIGGFDADKIEGNSLILGIGKANEPYEGIGRGPLNIEGLPVYRDVIGGIGTPTSDNERTKMDINTHHFLGLVNGYDGNTETIQKTILLMKELMEEFCEGKDFEIMEY
ncbi:MAG: hypothetical protein MJZ69_02260 [Bacteroidaceae bacterium]|nr:hypothetical protein [Bacteroidaceae bacterium]